MKNPPRVPKGVTAGHIRKFLEGLERINRLEKIKIPKDGSGALDFFCYNPLATTEAVSTMQHLPDIWQKVLPSLDILTLEPSQQDKEFIHEVAFQYTALSLFSVARSVRQAYKQRSLSHPLQLWHKTLTKTHPPAADVVFLCEKFELFAGDSPAKREEYEKIKLQHQNREAV